MADFSSGVAKFIHAQATVTVHFPVDEKGRSEIACRHCPYLSSNDRMCQLNKEPVNYPNKYVGAFCPLKEINNEIQEDLTNETN